MPTAKSHEDKSKLLKELEAWVKEQNIKRKAPTGHAVSSKITQDTMDLNQKLFCAIMLGEPAIIKTLLSIGADPNAVNQSDTSATEMALIHDRKDVAKILEEFGAKPKKTA